MIAPTRLVAIAVALSFPLSLWSQPTRPEQDTLAALGRLASLFDFPEQSTLCYQEYYRLVARTSGDYVLQAKLFERSGRPSDAIRMYEAAGDQLTDQELFRLLCLYTDKVRDANGAKNVYARLTTRSPRSALCFVARERLIELGAHRGTARACVDSGLVAFPANPALELARFRLAVLRRDSSSFEQLVPSRGTLAATDVENVIELGQLIRSQISPRFAIWFLECAEPSNRGPYLVWRSLHELYRERGVLTKENRVCQALCARDSVVYAKYRGYLVASLSREETRAARAAILSRFAEHAKALGDVAMRLDQKQRFGEARIALDQLLALPMYAPGADSLLKFQEQLMVLKASEGETDEAQRLARFLIGKCDLTAVRDSAALEPHLRRAVCYYVLDDVVEAEANLQWHSSRASIGDRRAAVNALSALADKGINRTDVLAATARFYGDVLRDSGVPGASAPPPASLFRMALDSFTSSNKVNPEPDKSYVLVRSLVPMLRFQSNRAIHKVEQISSGDWELWLPPGTHILKIDAPGYQRLELPPINFGKKRSYEISVRRATEE